MQVNKEGEQCTQGYNTGALHRHHASSKGPDSSFIVAHYYTSYLVLMIVLVAAVTKTQVVDCVMLVCLSLFYKTITTPK